MEVFFSILAKWLATCCSPTPPPPPPDLAEDDADDGELNVKPIVDGQVYLLREPADGMEVRVDIVFFHGLQLLSYEKAYLETWQVSTGGKEGEEKKIICWPKVWLGSDFPDARVLSVSYDSRAVGRSTETTRDIAKALLKSLVELAGVGHNRPVILVGHSLGGLVIKLMCKEAGQLQNAHDEDGGGKYVEFMENLLGVFFYATPHGGTALAREVCRKLGSVVHLAPALKFLAKENYNLLELTEDFNTQRRRWKWKTWALVEVQRIRLIDHISSIMDFAWSDTSVPVSDEDSTKWQHQGELSIPPPTNSLSILLCTFGQILLCSHFCGALLLTIPSHCTSPFM